MKIAVLISGGVDSSVALNILKDQGHDLKAFYLKIWLEEDFGLISRSDRSDISSIGACPWEEDLSYVRTVCDAANVPLEVVSMQREYWDKIVSYTLNQVKEGYTPNPDIFCNKLIKFGLFLEQYGDQFDKVATGHYAQVQEISKRSSKNGVYQLKCAPDAIKDQTYFLSYLDQKQLSKLIFPLGNLTKREVRDLAKKYNLPNKDRKDSQGICFLGKFKFEDFVGYYVGEKRGDLVEYETREKVGEHKGFWFHTIGQRRGIGLSGGPWYVVDKDTHKNIVYISKNYYSPEKARDMFCVKKMNWIAGNISKKNKLQVKMRHGKQRHNCNIEVLDAENRDDNNLQVILENSDQGIAPGQFAVFYDGDICLGGGIIAKCD